MFSSIFGVSTNFYVDLAVIISLDGQRLFINWNSDIFYVFPEKLLFDFSSPNGDRL